MKEKPIRMAMPSRNTQGGRALDRPNLCKFQHIIAPRKKELG